MLPATQPLVNTWTSTGQRTTAAHSVFTAVNALGHSAQTDYAALALHQPKRLSWANAALMQPAHGCTVHLHKRIGHSPQATSATAGQSLCLNICRHSVSAP